MLPQTAEQGGVAERTAQLGAGIRLGKPTAQAIGEAVDKVLTDSSYRENAQVIAEGFRNCTGAVGAADKILQVIEGK